MLDITALYLNMWLWQLMVMCIRYIYEDIAYSKEVFVEMTDEIIHVEISKWVT